jgi:hypothetical protein
MPIDFRKRVRNKSSRALKRRRVVEANLSRCMLLLCDFGLEPVLGSDRTVRVSSEGLELEFDVDGCDWTASVRFGDSLVGKVYVYRRSGLDDLEEFIVSRFKF